MKSIRQIQTVDSVLLSEYILQRGGAMSHLKLQKVLYYIQALHLAYFGHQIIEDEFEAWLHGPVSRVVFNRIKDLSVLHAEIMFEESEWQSGQTPAIILESILTSDQKELVDEVIDKYGILTASQLENLSHSESPWLNARKGYGVADRCNVVIPKTEIQEFYKEQIYGGESQN
jgi:uncharacterized phage-associated protein